MSNSTYKASDSSQRYNLVVIGGGPAGLATAKGAAALGARVALVEKDSLGGCSLHTGSVPSKVLGQAARAANTARRGAEFGVTAGPVAVDYAAIRACIQAAQNRIAGTISTDALRACGVDVHFGQARFTGRNRVRVKDTELPFMRAVIATGARPAVPPLPGLERINYLTSETIWRLDELPKRLAVIGAGVLGCELAQTFARLGSAVTLFEREARCLHSDDEAAAAAVQTALEWDGVILRCGCETLHFESREAETVVHAECGTHAYAVPCDQVLLTLGRVPHTEGIDLDAAGIRYDHSGIWVSAFLRTTNARVFAAGDVCSDYRYTHAAEALARIVIGNALFFGTERASELLVPRCVFTDPQVAHAGVTADEARQRRLKTLSVPLERLDRTVIDGSPAGFLKIYYDARGLIRGATLVAPNAADVMNEIVVAMNHRVSLSALASSLHVYPTAGEAIKLAGDTYRQELVTPAMARFLRRILRWRR